MELIIFNNLYGLRITVHLRTPLDRPTAMVFQMSTNPDPEVKERLPTAKVSCTTDTIKHGTY